VVEPEGALARSVSKPPQRRHLLGHRRWCVVRQPDSRVSDAARSRQARVPSLRFRRRVDGSGQRQRQAGYRVAAGALAAVLRWLSPKARWRLRCRNHRKGWHPLHHRPGLGPLVEPVATLLPGG